MNYIDVALRLGPLGGRSGAFRVLRLEEFGGCREVSATLSWGAVVVVIHSPDGAPFTDQSG
jgi:hypothetical protein